MKKIAILGGSPAVVTLIETIRSVDQSVEMMLFAFDGQFPFQRELAAGFLTKEVTLPQILCKPQSFYDQHHVKVYLNKQITRVNLTRNKIYTDEKGQKEQFGFDHIVLADVPSYKLPDMKGTNKSAVHSILRFDDIEEVFRLLPLSNTVVVQNNDLGGLRLSVDLVQKGKEVFLIVAEESLLSVSLKECLREEDFEELGQKGLRIIIGNAITEILGDADAKAIRLESGKVVAVDLVLLADVKEDLRLFLDSPLEINQRVLVNKEFKTNLEHVFALDGICENENIEFIKPQIQGSIAGAVISGQPVTEGLDQAESVQSDPLNISLEIFSLLEPIGVGRAGQSTFNEVA